jgi:seryl-tRNA synthetase
LVDQVVEADSKARSSLVEFESLRAEKNGHSKFVPQLLQDKKLHSLQLLKNYPTQLRLRANPQMLDRFQHQIILKTVLSFQL